MGHMKNFKQLIKELPAKTIVFAFGRFNPPTTGHELLIKAVKKLAQQKRADHVIYASRSQDAKKNPLSVERKVHYLNMMFPSTHFVGANDNVRTFIEAAKELNKKYKNIIMVAGSDRVAEFTRLLNTYNGKEFNFDTIEVISAGERDPDADNATGMSATKMRTLASKGDYAQFKKGLPSSMRDIDGKRLMNDIRQGMGLDAVREQVILVKDDLREQYFRGEIFNVGDIVESADDVYAIVKRGANHLLVQGTDGQMVSKWIKDVSLTERNFMLDEELTQKTLRPADKIKVARVLATMMGIEKPESSANPENLINLGLRRIRTKALNPEALAIVDKMLTLATQMGIKFDTALVPTKLKEAAPEVPKEVMSFKDFEKIKRKNNTEAPTDPINTSDKDAEKDPTHTKNYAEVGGSLVAPHPEADDNLRRSKVKYCTEEKKLAQSFVSRMHSEAADPAAAAAEKAAKETAKAQLAIKQAKEKEAFSAKQSTERTSLSDKLKNEEAEPVEEGGLWDNIHAKRKRIKDGSGERMRKPGSDGAPTAAALKQAAEEVEIEEKVTTKPGWMLKQDPKLAAKVKANVDLAKKRQASYGNPAAGKSVKEETEEGDDSDYEKIIQILDFSDETSDTEIDKLIADLTDDDIMDEVYDDDEVVEIDDETGEEIEQDEDDIKIDEHLHEVLSRMQRIKAKQRLRRTAVKRQRSTKIALKKFSSSKTINKRARRAAVKALKNRLLRGRNPNKLSVGEKERVERIIASKKTLVNRIALKMVPRVRKIEKARMSHGKVTKGSSPSVF
jgi:phosphopantetheine adenylyltransferase